MKKIIFISLIALLASMIFIPLIFNLVYTKVVNENVSGDNIEIKINPKTNVQIGVLREATNTVETYNLEEYVRGVVAAEMPADFHLEALKAQALAARTYIVKKIIEKDYKGLPAGAMVTDTVKHQVFLSDDDLKRNWGSNYQQNISKLNQAINETEGQVIVYDDKPIDALYFSTSNGFTENSEEYYQVKVPYLKSVESKWDLTSPKFAATKTVPFTEIKAKLSIQPAVATSMGQSFAKIMETTGGNRVKKIKIGDEYYTGREIRESFNLKSSDFSIDITDKGIIFHTKGYGHGVGMSQYGANGMAEVGASGINIIKHYYTGVKIENIEKWVKVN